MGQAGQCSTQRFSQHGLPRAPLFPAEAKVPSSQPGPQSTHAQGSLGMGDPAALAAPSQEAEESENKGVLGKAGVFIQSNGVDN